MNKKKERFKTKKKGIYQKAKDVAILIAVFSLSLIRKLSRKLSETKEFNIKEGLGIKDIP